MRGDGAVRLIVTAAPGRASELAGRLSRSQHRIVAAHPGIGAISIEARASAIADLAADPAVDEVSVDAPVKSEADEVGTLSGNMLLPTLALPAGGLTGKGVGVAVVDSGIVSHPEIPVAAFYDFVNGGKATKPLDTYGHGTHVAGLIADVQKWSDARYRSLAPGVRLIGPRALNGDGAGYTSTVIQAIEFATANKAQLGIDVLNVSLGHRIYEPAATDPLVRAVERAVAAGIVVVVSAGNEGINHQTGAPGYAGITSPGNAPSAITVGAVDTRNTVTRSDDEVPAFSSRGPTWFDAYAKPDLVAPGRRVVSFMAKNSAIYARFPAYRVDVAKRTYMTLSGTSMSAAATSSVVALLIEASRSTNTQQRALPPNAIKAILQYTAVPLANVDPLTQGAGSLNAAGAIAVVRSIDPTVSKGSWWLVSGVTPTTRLPNGEDVGWSQEVFWGERVLTGDTIAVNQPAWATTIVWGNSLVWGNTIVWANSLVWGNALVWGNTIVWGNAVLGCNANGTVMYGANVNWSSVDATALVWGNLSGASTAPTSNSVPQFTPIW